MNCIEHEGKEAVVNCASCGVGLCKECEANTAFRFNNQALCRKCNIEAAHNNEQYLNAFLNKKKLAMGIVIAGIVIGLIVYLLGKIIGSEYGIFWMLICWGIGGSIGVFITKSQQNEKQGEKPKGTLLNRIAALIGAFIGAAIVAPVFIIFSLIGIKKVNKQIAENDAVLARLGVGNNQQGKANGMG